MSHHFPIQIFSNPSLSTTFTFSAQFLDCLPYYQKYSPNIYSSLSPMPFFQNLTRHSPDYTPFLLIHIYQPIKPPIISNHAHHSALPIHSSKSITPPLPKHLTSSPIQNFKPMVHNHPSTHQIPKSSSIFLTPNNNCLSKSITALNSNRSFQLLPTVYHLPNE